MKSVPMLFAVFALFVGISSLAQQAVKGGGLDKTVIDENVKKALPAIRECIKKEERPVVGKLVMKFAIGGDGKVTNTEPKESSLENITFETCVGDAIKGVQFPEPVGHGNVDVVYPFSFTKKGVEIKAAKKSK